MARKDVFEVLVNGTSGIMPGNVSGSTVVSGVCSLGTVGKIYYVDRRTDLKGLLGSGPLTDRLNDVFKACKTDDIKVMAIPVLGHSSEVVGDVFQVGNGPAATVSGVAGENADIIVSIEDAGVLGTATHKLSQDDGATWDAASSVPADGQITVGTTGTTIVIAPGSLEAGTTYSYAIRKGVGSVTKVGDGPNVTVAGAVKRGAQVELVIVKGGSPNEGQYKLSVDGGDNYSPYKTLPVDHIIAVEDTGVTLTIVDDTYILGDTYSIELMEPVPTISDVITAASLALETVNPELIYIAGALDSVGWMALSTFALDLFAAHKPTLIICEARTPYEGESLDDWTTWLLHEKDGVALSFVGVCTAFGEIVDRNGYSTVRNAGGLLVGRIISIPVMRDIGRVRDGAITGLTLPEGYRDSMQSNLEDGGYITLTRYEGLEGVYWGTGKLMAEPTSDYQRIEIVRVVFKGLRLTRIQALKSLKDELGDPVQGMDASGLAFLRTNLETALDVMTLAKPPELAGRAINIPMDQDFVNNGVAVEQTMIGIPIIDKITLHTNYAYAGTRFDPRVEG
jgi:hypothetical protein